MNNKSKNNMDVKEAFEFDVIGMKLDMHIQIEAREMITKGFVNTSIRRGLQVFVHSNDHEPCHFHINSDQRNFKQKFSVDSLKNISKIQDNRFDGYIKKYFVENKEDLLMIKNKFYALNPALDL